MREVLLLGGLREFLFTNGNGLIARNSRATELDQASTHLSQGVLPWIPRPIEGRQWDGHDPGREELQQHMRNTQKQRPPADALARAALVVSQAQCFDLIEVDFDLEAPRIGMAGRDGIQRQIGAEQVPGREGTVLI